MTEGKVRVSDVFDRWGVTIGLFIVIGAIATTALESIRDKLVIDVALLAGKAGSVPARPIPRRFGRAYRIEGRHADVYAVRPLHWILRAWWWWRWRRWALEDLLFRIGWMEGDNEEAPTFRSLRFGNPARIILDRMEMVRVASRAARVYAVARSIEEAYARGLTEGREQFIRELEALRDEVRDLRHGVTIEPGRPMTPGLAALESEIERTR